jgi:hypothetical protein
VFHRTDKDITDVMGMEVDPAKARCGGYDAASHH